MEDYIDYVTPQAGADDSLARLSQLAKQQEQATIEVALAEAKLDELREELRDLKERQIPELMDEVGISEFKTSSGLCIKVEEVIRAGINKTREAEAFAWLRENGYGALIKRSISVSFGRGQDEEAEALLHQLGPQYEHVENSIKVHPQTLSAWVREKLREGQNIPLELLGVHRQRVSKIV